jgi:hypothetical protein
MPADGTYRRPLLACGSLGALRSQGGLRIPYARRIEIEMRPAYFFYVTRLHLSFSKSNDQRHRFCAMH